MRKIYFNIVIGTTLIGGIHYTGAQENDYHPYKQFGGEHVKMLTLSNGKYNEFFDTDSIEIVGSAILNTNTMCVIGFVEPDTLYSEATLEPEVVSRFLSIDPLAAKYPHNSPYAFSENSTIAFIELEGLERYYAADGELLGVLNNSSEIRVLTSADKLATARKHLTGQENQKSERLQYLLSGKGNYSFSKFYNSADKSNLRIASNVLTSIYTQMNSQNNLQDGYVKLVNSQSGNVIYGDLPIEARFTLKENASSKYIGGYGLGNFYGWNHEGHVSINQFVMENNYYDLAITLYHESLHSDGVSGGAWGEFEAHYKATQHSLYDKTSKDFQYENLESLKTYLDMQEIFVSQNPDHKRGKELYDKNRKLYNQEKERYEQKYEKDK